MKVQSFRRNTLLLSSIMFVLTILLTIPNAFAVPGDELADIFCDDDTESDSVGVGFDGTYLYYPRGFFATSLGVCDTDGNLFPDIPLVGLVGGDTISTISYDSSRGLFWAATPDKGGSVRGIYQITSAGSATFMYNVVADGALLTDGLAYDGEDDSLWISGDVSNNIYHYDTDGTLIAGPIPIPNLPGCGNSGIASGIGVLYLGFNGCNVAQKHNKADLSFVEQYNLGTGRTEDMECDNLTFPGVDAIWTKDAYDAEMFAFEVPDGTCPVGGGGGHIVGGSILPIDASALLIAGAFTNAVWMAPVLVGTAGIVAFYIKTRKN